MDGKAFTWGSTTEERAKTYPCDEFVAKTDASFFRAVTIEAAPAVVFRWLCQLRVAAYSYDWVDQLGRKSPRALTAQLENLELGQSVMKIFRIVAFDTDKHMTLLLASRPRGGVINKLAVSYVVDPAPSGHSRLIAKVAIEAGKTGLAWRLGVRLLAIGDLIMMRKQLLTLKALCEA